MTRTNQLVRKILKFCGGRHCFHHCSWPFVKQNDRLLIGLNRVSFVLLAVPRSPSVALLSVKVSVVSVVSETVTSFETKSTENAMHTRQTR